MTIYKQGDRGEVVKRIQKLVGAYPDGIWGAVTTECVKVWQRRHGLKASGIVGPATLAKMGLAATAQAVSPALDGNTINHNGIVLKTSKRRINYIVVHCTATPEGQAKTVEQIRKEHKAEGWSDIGYHYVVTLDGKVHLGRDVDVSGAHVSGHNADSIGVVYVGGLEKDSSKPYEQLKPKDTRTGAQKTALMMLLMDLRRLYPKAVIQGHCDFLGVKKACPSFDAKTEYRFI